MLKSEQPPAGEDRLAELKREADHARRRYELYRARIYGSRPSSPARLSELQRESERAATRLRRAGGERA